MIGVLGSSMVMNFKLHKFSRWPGSKKGFRSMDILDCSTNRSRLDTCYEEVTDYLDDG